jgi:hypothetical protein
MRPILGKGFFSSLLEWNAGFLVGLTNAVPKFTPRWQFEYEIHY